MAGRQQARCSVLPASILKLKVLTSRRGWMLLKVGSGEQHIRV